MKLLLEKVQDFEILTEDIGDKKDYFIHGIFLQSEIKNRNGRIYPKEILGREVNSYNENFILKNRAVGELSHPNNVEINLDKISHKITELKQVGNDFIGKAKLLETPNGQIAINLIKGGVSLGVSSRAIGSLRNEKNAKYVNEDLRLITAADIVFDPSAPNAFVDHILEQAEWVYESGKWSQQFIEEQIKEVKNASKSELEEKYIKIFEEFVKKI